MKLSTPLPSLNQYVPTSDSQSTRIIAITLVAGLLLSKLSSTTIVNFFAVIPAYTFYNYHLWTFVTAMFVETSFILGVINIAIAWYIVPTLDKIWGQETLGKFMSIVGGLSYFLSYITCVFEYNNSEVEAFIYHPLCGFSCMNAAFAVALMQRFPDRSVIPSIDLIKCRHLPMMIWISGLLIWFGTAPYGGDGLLMFYGVLFSWIYLRFFMVDPDTNIIGDLRNEFEIAEFFPDVYTLRPLVRTTAAFVMATLLRFGIFASLLKSHQQEQQRQQEQQDKESLLPSSASSSKLNAQLNAISTNIDPFVLRAADPKAEHRRALAMKAIDDKLAELCNNNTDIDFLSSSLAIDESQINALEKQLFDSELLHQAASSSLSDLDTKL